MKLKPQHVARVGEDELEEMFEYSADNVDELADNWDEAMKVVKTTELIYPPDRPSEEQLASIRATQPTSTLASLVNSSDTLQR